MGYAIDWEMRVKTILTAQRMERSAVLMDVKTTVLNLVSHLLPLFLLFKYLEHSVQLIGNEINKHINI